MCDHRHRSTFRCLQGSTKNRFGTLAFLRTVVCRYQAHTDRNNNRIALCSSFKSVHIKIAVYSHSTIITVVIIYSATTIFSIQSPHIRLMTLVARQLLLHLGQIYLRVLLGFFVLVSAPAPLLTPLGSVPSTSSRLRLSTIWKSCQPCSSTKSRSSRPGLVIVQPYLGWCSTSRPWVSAMCLKFLLWYTPLLLVSFIPCSAQYSCTISWTKTPARKAHS